MTRVFLDANVYFAGSFSESGASSVILELARRRKVQLVATKLVLREADRNLRKKTDPKTLKRFHRFLRNTPINVVPALPDTVLQKYEPYIHPKDVPILAAAIEAAVDYLVTLDRRHFLTEKVNECAGKIKVLTPGDFIRIFPPRRT